jgi:ProP effector
MTRPDAPQEAPPTAATAHPETHAVTEASAPVDGTLAEPDPAPQAGDDPMGADAPADLVADAAATAETEGAAAAAAATPAAPDLSPAATGRRLAALFPALFVGPDGKGVWKAIKLRIHADIQARAPGEFSKRALAIFFSRYTTTTAYLKALAAPGAQRHDLDGQPAGEIAEEHRSAAAEEVARRQAIVAERRAAARKAQMPQRLTDAAPEGGESATPSRPPRAERPPREAGGPRQGGERRNAPMQERPARAPRREPPPHARPGQRRDGGGAPRHEPRPAAHESAPPAFPVDPAQRERALLLRAFDSSPLSKANFCALKRMSEAELDTLLAQARAERDTR